jgi:hypothetical protein
LDSFESSRRSILASSASMLGGSVGESKGGSKFGRGFGGAALAVGGRTGLGCETGDCRAFFAGDGQSALGLWFAGWS